MAHRCCLGKLPLRDDDRACTALIRLRRRTGSPPGPVAGAVEVNWQRNATTSLSAGAKGREAAAQVAAPMLRSTAHGVRQLLCWRRPQVAAQRKRERCVELTRCDPGPVSRHSRYARCTRPARRQSQPLLKRSVKSLATLLSKAGAVVPCGPRAHYAVASTLVDSSSVAYALLRCSTMTTERSIHQQEQISPQFKLAVQ